MQNVVRGTAGKVLAIGSAFSVSATATTVNNLQRQSTTEEPRHVFQPEVEHLFNDAEYVEKVDAFEKAPTSPENCEVTNPTGMSDMVISTIHKVSPTPVEINAALQSIHDHPEVMDSYFPNFGRMDDRLRDTLASAVRDVIQNASIVNATQQHIRNAEGISGAAAAEPVYDRKHHAHEKASSADENSSIETGTTESLQYGIYPYTSIHFEEEVHVREDGSVLLPQREASLQWETVRDKYPCAICQDLLAAPTILNCSHSFCGICLNDMIESCGICSNSEDGHNEEGQGATTTAAATAAATAAVGGNGKSSVEIEYHCPSCKEPITNSIFERLLDQDIQRLVDSIPDCPAKRHWKERRARFLRASSDWAAAGRTGVDAKVGYAHLLGGSSSANQQQRGPGANGGYPEDERGSWSEVFEWAVPVLTLAVLALIAVVRSLK